ncbi:hypothetical protein TKK_0007095 [Trichogramma kaykai]
MTFLGHENVEFHVISQDIPIPCEGILGSAFFRQSEAIFDFGKKTIQLSGLEIPLRTRQSISLKPQSDIEDFEQLLHEVVSDRELLMLKHSANIKPIHIPTDTEDYLRIFNVTDMDLNTRTTMLQEKVDTSHLRGEELQLSKELLHMNSDRFYLEGDELTATNIVEHRIPTYDDLPVNQRQYRLAHHLKEEVDKQVADLLKKGIIRDSRSSYNSALWVVPKKAGADGKPRWRVVVDFRPLNEKTVTMSYPLPNINDIFDQIGNAKYFTVIDCVAGFHQIKLHPADAHKTAFSTPRGHFEFVRMPFGLKNAGVEYQRAMNFTLEGIIGRGAIVYMDDVIIYSQDLETHKKLFNEVMERFRKANWQLEPSKCNILCKKVKYLGHVISGEGISLDPDKVKAVKEFPTPKKLRGVREFLGLAGYYRRFIKDFAKIAKPLTTLLQKDTDFIWSENCDTAFQTLKNALCNAPLLIYPDFSKPFIITTDASGYAIGGILSQGEPKNEHPVAYTSRMLRGPELNYDTYEKEALAIVHAVEQFRPYIYGHPFIIYTDHQPLVWFKTAELNTRIQKWRFKLAEYQYDIRYKVGKSNCAADALSRNPVEINIVTRAQQKKLDKPTPTPEQTNSAGISSRDQEPLEKLSLDHEHRPMPRPRKQISNKEDIPTPAPRRSTRSKPWLDAPKISPAPKDKLQSNRPNLVETDNKSSDESDEEVEDTSVIKRPQDGLKPPHEDVPVAPPSKPTTPPPQEQLSDDSDTSDAESEEEGDHTAGKAQIVTCKDAIESRKNILIYFSDTHGKPLDQGGIKLLDKNMIPPELTVPVGQVRKTIKSPSKKRQIYALGLREATPQSEAINIKNLILCLQSLRTELESTKISEFSIAKTNTVDNIEWGKVLKALHDVFSSTSIKVIICLGTLTYVNPTDRDDIFYECHNSPMGGHKGVSKTFHRIRRKYYWENLKGDIQRRIQQCLECQLKKLVRVKTKMPMIITDTPGTTFDKIALDIVGPLPPTKKGNAYILTMQDQLSKYCIAAPLPDMKTTTVADAFIKRLVCTFGSPRIIITDQGRNFVSQLMRRVAVRLKVKQVRTTAFHPQSNGSLERSHHALCEYLKIYADSDRQWDDWVELASFNYNTNVQESTKYTPHEVVFGRLARIPSAEPLREADQLPTYEDYIVNLVTKLNDIRKIVYDNLISTKQKTKLHYDKHIHPIDFKVGEHIFLLKGIKKGKLDDNYTGPHEILEVYNNNTLKIDINNKPKIVHANRVKSSKI